MPDWGALRDEEARENKWTALREEEAGATKWDALREEETRATGAVPGVRQRVYAAGRSTLGWVGDQLSRDMYARTALEHEFVPEIQKAAQTFPHKAHSALSPLLSGNVGYMTALGMQAAASAAEKRLAEGAKEPGALLPVLGEMAKRAGSAIGRGASLKERWQPAEITEAVYGPPKDTAERIGRAATGMASGLLLSPTTYLGGGMLTEAGRTAKAIGKLAPTLALQAAAKQRALVTFAGQPIVYGGKVLEPASKGMGALRSTEGMQALAEAVGHYRPTGQLGQLLEARSVKVAGIGIESAKTRLKRATAISQLAKKHGLPYQKTASYVDDLVEAGVTGEAKRLMNEVGRGTRIADPRLLDELDALERGIVLPPAARRIIDEVGEQFLDDAQPIADALESSFRKMLENQWSVGVKIKDLQNMGYLGRRTMTDEVDALVRKAADIGGPYRDLPTLHRAMKRRVMTSDYTLREATEIFRDPERGANFFFPELDRLGKVFTVERPFIADPAALERAYAMSAAKVGTAHELTEGLKNIDGALHVGAEKVPAGYRAVAINERLMPHLDGWVFDETLAGQVERHVGTILDPKTSSAAAKFFLHKLYDPGLQWWKAYTLAVIPAYHVRNAVGNTWNAFLGGLTDPTKLTDAAAIQVRMWEPTTAIGRAAKKAWSPIVRADLADDIARKYGWDDAEHAWQEMTERGATGHGFIAAESAEAEALARDVTRGGVARTVQNVIGPRGTLVRGGRTAGSLIEDNAKVAMFLDSIADPAMANVPRANVLSYATDRMKTFLFDYDPNALTTIEREGFRRIAPFYTWTRYNLPLQFREVLRQPGKYAGINKAFRSWDYALGPQPDERYMEDWLAKSDPMRVAGSAYLPMTRTLPAGEIMDVTQPGQTVIDLLSPVIKLPIELTANYSLYNQRPIANPEEPWARTDLLGMHLPPRLAYAAKGLFRPLSVANQVAQWRTGETSGPSLLTQLLIGKAYDYDPRKARDWYEKGLDSKISLLEYRIDNEPDAGERARLVSELRELYGHYRNPAP